MNIFRQLPPEFITTVTNTFGSAGQQWLDSLDTRLQRIQKRWSIEIKHVLKDLNFNIVATVTLPDGRTAILKSGVPAESNSHMASEIAALRHFQGDGAVKLYQADPDEGCLLMEKLEPGESLLSLDSEEESLKIACELMLQLHKPAPESTLLPSVGDWGQELSNLYNNNDSTALPFDNRLVHRAHDLNNQLLKSMGEPVVLHGDWHHANILSARRQPWLAIDPKGVTGGPEYETGALVRNPSEYYMTDFKTLKRRLAIICEITGFDWHKVHGWSLAQAVLAAWRAYSGQNEAWRLFLDCARTLDEIH